MGNAPLIPANWQIPDYFRRRLGTSVGRQRLMSDGGHLLIVSHQVPEAGNPTRQGVLFWLNPEGEWKASNGDPGKIAIGNLLSIYENCVRNTRLSGPTYFLHFLREFLTSVQNSSHNTYHVLVVLTDGSLHDEKPTRDLLVEMSYLPVSVIVVGIGQTDFKLMNQFNYERLKNSLG